MGRQVIGRSYREPVGSLAFRQLTPHFNTNLPPKNEFCINKGIRNLVSVTAFVGATNTDLHSGRPSLGVDGYVE
jgi:hypothetical protein